MHDILLADDEPMVLRILRLALESAGYGVRVSANGEQALAAIRERVPDLLITDLDMPRMDGLELIAALETEMPGRPFPVCVLTGKTALEHRQISREFTDIVFLEKPVSVRLLLAMLSERFHHERKSA